MASPQDASHPLRRKSSANNLTVNKRTETDLSKSLRQLSLSTEAANAGANSQLSPRSPLTRTASSPLYPPSRHASPSPNHRATSRSPSSSVSGERTLLRKASTNSLRSANGMIHGHSSSRRSSFARTMSPTLSTSPDRIPLTAAAVAKGCFQEELDVLHGESSTASTNTVVILNDAVYGHRFSRPRTSKNALSTIVERPERIKAGVLGISMAYVRLGERHCEGGQPPHPKRDVHGMQSVPFKIHKTTRRLPLVSPAVTNVHGTKWMEELKTMCESAEAKLTAGSKELQRPERSRGEPAAEKFHEGDLYLCSESLNAIEGALGAVCEAVDTVFGPGPSRAFVGVRPPGHHCSASHPSGFCWVNNVHVGIMHAAMEHGLTHAAIIDFDLHHGDGSQSIAWQHNKRANTATKNAAPWKKSSIGYFSLHDINSYPCEGGDDEKVKNASLCIDNAHGQSVWNVHLQPYKSEQDFWDLYETKYSILLEKTRNYLRTQYERVKSMKQTPKAAIFFSAGFDASEWEGAGMQRHQVNVPTEFYARLSQDVTKVAEEEGLGVDGRVISVLEGGYSDRALYTGVCSHLSGLVGEQTIPPPRAPSESSSSLGTEMGQRISAVAEEPEETEFASKRGGYDASWWTARELESLEHRMANPEPLPRVVRQQSPGSYASPTQASTAKVVDPANMRRSLSGLGNGRPMSRPSSPPVPDVPWTIATHELCKLLIPTDRQVDSCKAEDLNAEATRARQARQSSVAPPPERGASRMSLRGRKPKTAALEVETTTTVNRRRTVGAPSAAEKASRSVPTTPAKTTARRASRRLSGVPAVPAVPDEPMPQSGPAAPSNTSRAPAPKPELSAAGRSQSGSTINVKKTRPSTAGTGAKREPAGKVTAPPRGSKKLAAVGSRSEVMDSPDPLTAARPATAHGDEMDKLTTGMKKIKINLITKSQKEARERAQQEEAAKAAAALPSSSSTPLAEGNTGPHIDTRLGSPEVEIPSASTSQAGTGDLVSPVESTSDAGRYVPLGGYTASSGVTSPEPDYKPMDTLPGPGTPTIIPQVAIQHSDATDDFIPYQPEGPSPEALTRTEPLKWMPPNINTPAATPSPAKKDQTFKQTSGPIPFGPRQGSSAVKGFQLPASKEAKNGSSL